MAGNNGGNGGMMIVVLLGGVCCLCLMCSGGLGLLYAFNQDFKNRVNKLFGIGGGAVSSMAGQWVCPDVDPGMAAYIVSDKGNQGVWCEHPDSKTSTDPNIKNFFLASKLPSEAKAGKTYTRETLLTEDGANGEYGPSKPYGYKPTNARFTAP